MIITKIKGGLGNQLFQYAVGRAVALHHKVPLKLDLTIFETYKLHNGYRLDQFAIQADIAPKNEIIKLKGGNNVLFSALRKVGLVKRKSYFKEKRTSYFDASVFKNNSVYLDGYWQNELYFKNIRELLLRELSPVSSMSDLDCAYLECIKNSNSVSLHVRRGDYLNSKNINVLDVDYYVKAVDYIRKNVKNPTFYIFSDDLEWCKNNLGFLNGCIYVDRTQTEIDDLKLMSFCRHNIIANSSFSWWGAWLNQNPKNTVIAPKGWLLNDPGSSNVILSDWVKF
jgi:hypothetical protein